MSEGNNEYFKKLKNQMPEWETPKLNMFDSFTLLGPYSLNGYVVVPNDFPLNYFDDIYEVVEDNPVGGITYGGYVTLIDGELQLAGLDQQYLFTDHVFTDEQVEILKEAKTKCLPVLGFDDNHASPIQLSGLEGAEYLANELRKIEIK